MIQGMNNNTYLDVAWYCSDLPSIRGWILNDDYAQWYLMVPDRVQTNFQKFCSGSSRIQTVLSETVR